MIFTIRARRPKRRTRGLQDGPRGPQDGPRRPQDGPRGAQDGPRAPQERTKRAQEGPKTAQESPKRRTREPQDGPQRLPRGPQHSPGPPRWPKRAPGRSKKAPRRPQRASKGPPNRPGDDKFVHFLRKVGVPTSPPDSPECSGGSLPPRSPRTCRGVGEWADRGVIPRASDYSKNHFKRYAERLQANQIRVSYRAYAR